jgi:hypothetical protein
MTFGLNPRYQRYVPWIAGILLWTLTLAQALTNIRMGAVPHPVVLIISLMWTVVFVARGAADAGRRKLPEARFVRACVSWPMVIALPIYLFAASLIGEYGAMPFRHVTGCVDVVVEVVEIPILIVALAWSISGRITGGTKRVEDEAGSER